MTGETPFDTEERVIDEARHALATGGLVSPGAAVPIVDNGCALAIPATATCECGRDLHITVNLDPKQIEAAVKRILVDARRRAMTRGSG